MTEPNRFLDTRETLYHFSDEYLVACPQCNACARVLPLHNDRQNFLDPRRVTCQSCSYSKDWQGKSISIGTEFDSYFRLPLWLQIPVENQILWAYNLRHLELIESFVRATLRQRRTDLYGCRNASIISRLPSWVKAAKNRRHILKAIDRMRQK